MLKLLSEYKNGNYTVKIYDDGTKIRETEDDVFNAEFPENIDIKITNMCNNNCTFCYESSTPSGKHGILNYPFINSLKPYTELAIGGGNPLEHPDLEEFLLKLKSKNIIANITIRQNDFITNYELLKYYSDNKLIYGIGISLIDPNDEFINLVKDFPNAVIHTIIGILTPHQIIKMYDQKLKILILGYKTLGKGVEFKNENEESYNNNFEFLNANIIKMIPKFKVLSFDNLALTQLDMQSKLPNEIWEECYMGDDGQHTMYIDLVKRTYSKNSLSQDRFNLLDDITHMFSHVKTL